METVMEEVREKDKKKKKRNKGSKNFSERGWQNWA